jgi:hypothetical protein
MSDQSRLSSKSRLFRSLRNLTTKCVLGLKKPIVQDTLILLGIGFLSTFWFGNQQQLWGDDANFPLDLSIISNRYFHIWNGNSGFADVFKLPTIAPLQFALLLYHMSGLPYLAALFERILLIVLVSGASISMSQLLRSLNLEDRVAVLLGSIFYAFNFFSMLTIWFPLAYIMFEYAFFPLILSRFVTAFKKNKGMRYALTTALIWTITVGPGYGTITLLITNLAILTSYLLFYLIRNRFRGAHYPLKFFSLTLGVWAIINVFWLVPVFTYFQKTTKYAAISDSLSTFSAGSVRLFDAIRLTGYWGLTSEYRGSQYYPWYTVYETIPFLLVSCIPFLLALIGYFASKKNVEVRFFAAMIVVSLILVNGLEEPFAQLNALLFSNPMLLTAFRSPYQRFTEYVALGYSVLIGFFWARAARTLSLSKVMKRIHLSEILAVLLIVILSGIYLWPLWTGRISEQNNILVSRKVTVPSSYWEAADWFSTKGENFNILPIPYPSSTSSTQLLWLNGSEGYAGLYPLILMSTSKLMIQNPIGMILSSAILNGTITDSAILALFNVKYILVNRDANIAYIEKNSKWISADLDHVENSLSHMSGLSLEQSFENLDIYTNTKYESNRFFASYSMPFDNASASFLLNVIGGGYTNRIQFLLNEPLPRSSPWMIPLEISYFPGMKPDFSDIRFTLFNETTKVEATLPSWIEQFESARSATIWTRIPAGGGPLVRINMYYGSSSQSNSRNGSSVFNFFDDFTDGFRQWSHVGLGWRVDSSQGIYGNQSVYASGSSSALIRDKQMCKALLCGWFKFGENNENHYPFLFNDNKDGWNYWLVAMKTGEFGWFNGTSYVPYPVRMPYTPGCWYLVKLYLDLPQAKFWVTVNGTLLTPEGLPTINAKGRLAERLQNWRILNAQEGRNATMWVGAAWTGNFTVVNARVSEGEPVDIAYSVDKVRSFDEVGYDAVKSKLNAPTDFYVVLNEPYDPSWELWTNGSETAPIEHFSLFGLVNAWRVPTGGDLQITVTYLPQSLLNSLYVVSLVAFACTFAVALIWERMKLPELLKEIRMKIFRVQKN